MSDDGEVKVQPVSLTLALVLLAIFGVQLLIGGTEGGMARMGATHPSTMAWGHWWLLGSSTLIHFGVVHALFNAMFVAWVGSHVEVTVGPWRMLTVFFVGGLAGSVLSVLVRPDAIGAGASGGAWGLMIAELLLVSFAGLRQGHPPTSTPGELIRLVALNGFISVLPGIGGLAHLGGGIGGGLALVVSAVGGAAWAVPALVLVVAHGACLYLALSTGQPWAGWPELGDPVERSFFDGLVLADVPEHLRVIDEGEGTNQAGEMWWHGVRTHFLPMAPAESDAWLEEVRTNWGVPRWDPASCGPRCDAYEGETDEVVVFVGRERVYDEMALMAVSFVDPSAPASHRDWGRAAVLGARFGDEQGTQLWLATQRVAQPAKAEQLLSAMIEEDPQNTYALNLLAWHLATHPDDAARDGDRAVALATRAVALAPDDVNLIDTLAAAHAERGDVEEAVATQERAVALDPDNEGLTEHLERFRAGHPVRDRE